MDRIRCPICLSNFSSEKRPLIICSNGHSVCQQCFNQVPSRTCCICRNALLSSPIVNFDVLSLIEAIHDVMAEIPVIQAEELIIEPTAFGFGGSADIFRATWNREIVAVKRIRTTSTDSRQLSQLKAEISVHVGLRHPCIISLFGYTSNSNGREIVMEYAQRGSLNQNWRNVNTLQRINWGLDVVDGLQYLHSRKIVHRDLKPENILIAQDNRAKLSDFGMARVLATVQNNTSSNGTPKYTAPELLDIDTSYGSEVDVYSLSFIFYEMFSGQIAFENLTAHQLLNVIYIQKRRPTIDSTFPEMLKGKIELGWSHDAKDRCKLDDFHNTLLEMQCPLLSSNQTPITNTVNVSMIEQANITQMNLLPYSRTIEMKWPAQNEETKARIDKMMSKMRESSSFRNIFNNNILNAMLQVPKHLFFDLAEFKSINGTENDTVCLNQIFEYHTPQRVNRNQNMSSTEITCAQLSLIPLNAGDRVLFLGAKGGYIQTIAAQIVGLQGEIWICSQDNDGIKHIENVRQKYIPTILRQIIQCILVNNSQDINEIKNGLEQHTESIKAYFNTILICGAISEDMLDNFKQLLKMDGQLLAPININGNTQKFTILHKTRNNTSGQVTFNKRVLNDWSVRFQLVH